MEGVQGGVQSLGAGLAQARFGRFPEIQRPQDTIILMIATPQESGPYFRKHASRDEIGAWVGESFGCMQCFDQVYFCERLNSYEYGF